MPEYDPPNAFYTQVSLPKHIKPEIFIGREGCHLKRMTELSGCDYLWYDFERGVIEVWGKEHRLPKAVKMLNKRIDSFSAAPLPPPPSHVPSEYYQASEELQSKIKVVAWNEYPKGLGYIISGLESDVMKFYFENILAVYPTNPYATAIKSKETKPDDTIHMLVKRSSTCE
jgi:hypothetical protein